MRRAYWFVNGFFYYLFDGLFKRERHGSRWFPLYCHILKTCRRYEVYVEDEKRFPFDDYMIFPYFTRQQAEDDTAEYAYRSIRKVWWI